MPTAHPSQPGQSPTKQDVTHVPLLSVRVPDGHSHWQVVVLKTWPEFVRQLLETQLPPHSTCPDGQAAHVPPTQAPLQHCLSFLHFLAVGLHSSSATATPPRPSDPSVPPTRAAPINLSALPRVRVPSASPLARS